MVWANGPPENVPSTSARSKTGTTGDTQRVDLTPTQRHYNLIPDFELAAREPPAWLIAEHLTEGGLSVLYGQPGSGKTFLALDWAFAIARGVPWCGRATKRGPVIYVANEGGHGIAGRVGAYRLHHRISQATGLVFVTDTVRLLELRDVTALVDAADLGLRDPTIGEPVNPALVVIDTFARSLVGGDENSAQDVGMAIAAADAIRSHTTAHVLLVHHTTKGGELERGSSALRGAADTMFLLSADGLALKLECSKQKDAAAIDPQELRLVPEGPSCIVAAETRDPRIRPLTPNERKALQALAKSQPDWPLAASGWEVRSGLKHQSFYDARGRLMELGAVLKEGRGYVVSPVGLSCV